MSLQAMIARRKSGAGNRLKIRRRAMQKFGLICGRLLL
jgi:hypothetical protein